MKSRTFNFASLLVVIGLSIVFGMVLGGRLNAPQVTFAAPAAGPLRLAPAVTSGGMTDFADIVENSMPAVVSVRSTNLPGQAEEEGEGDERQQGSPEEWFFRRFFGEPDEGDPRGRPPGHPRIGEGSGFVISEDGYLLTNNHVVEGADSIRVGMQDGRDYEASVVGTDPSIDLALLKVNTKGERLPTVPLGDSDALRVGEWVIAIGNPLEFEQTVTVGVISAKDRRVAIGQTDTGVVSFLQTDAAINFGNSGGPLLDGKGNVVGINTAIRRSNYAEGIGFALPINHARSVIDQLRERGYVKRGYMGITMNQEGIDEEAREYLGLPDGFGVIVEAVADPGPAERAGIEPQDVIRKVDGQVVRDNLDLIAKIASKQPGDSVAVEVYRKDGGRGKALNFTMELEDREEGLRAGNRTQRPAPNTVPPEPEFAEATALGMTVKELTRNSLERLGIEDLDGGVLVTDVEFSSQAADKGIMRDMIIVSINDRVVESVEEWERAVESFESGQVIKMGVLAGPRELTKFLRVP